MNYLINLCVSVFVYGIMLFTKDPNAFMTAILTQVIMNVGDQIKKAIEKP